MIDSGIGGLGLLKCCKELCCDFVFVMDNAFCPYGEKTPETIVKRITKICAEQCENKHICSIILACNTATSVAIDEIRKNFSIPIIGMEPPIKTAVLDNKKHIIVMSTPLTNKFCKVIKRYQNHEGVRLASFCDLAKKIEQNFFDKSNLTQFLRQSFTQDDLKKCDALVLGCSHFQYVEAQLREIFGENVVFYHSEQGVKKRLIQILGDNLKEGNAKIAIVQTQYDKELLTIAKEILCN